MSAARPLQPWPASTPLAETLDRFGFGPRGEDWVRGELRLRQTGRWVIFEQPHGATASSLDSDLGQPGLWRTVTADERVARVFELPAALLEPENTLAALEAEDGQPEESAFAACVAWALTTQAGDLPAGWRPEPRETIEALIPKDQFTVLGGTSVRQGELVHTPGRLALRFPIVTSVSVSLPAARRQRLHEFLADARNHWSLVRVDLTSGANDAAAVLAEIDLTGAPAGALEPLLLASLVALRHVVARLVETAEVLTDAAVASAALDAAASFQPPTKEPA